MKDQQASTPEREIKPFSYQEKILLGGKDSEGLWYGDHFAEVDRLVTEKDDPDEKFFIRTHRAFEIWFAEILDEIDFAYSLLSQEHVPEDYVPRITHHIHRAALVFDLLRNHLPVLETLQTSSFYEFRSELFPASGGDSYRFKMIEWSLGFLDEDLWSYVVQRQKAKSGFGDGGMLDSLKRYQESHGLRDASAGPAGGVTLQSELSGSWAPSPSGDIPEHMQMKDLPVVTDRWAAARRGNTLRSALCNWLSRTPFVKTLEGTDVVLREGQCDEFRDLYIKAYVQAYVDDVLRLIELGTKQPKNGQDLESWKSDELEKARQFAKGRADWFMGDQRRAAVVFILQFSQQPLLAWPAMLLEAFIDLDEAMSNWRERHVQMVSHVLGGGRVSTAGQEESGLGYLRPTTSKKAFPEIWDARSFFLSGKEARALYPQEPAVPGERFPSSLRPLRLAFELTENKKRNE